ncbi:NYN domain-containing protein [Ruania rhizosphaerae]|uniref:NYN domain-containing protein n=1 Tax=Ruania rhizosphaerae TaxID=1840413 RepID=UPI00135A8E76|nr:NYN domain-containing protein [Ruania rhizosphaerae]
MSQTPDGPRTYLLVDGENIDATLGMSVLGRRPNPDERPRWDRITEHARSRWGNPVTALFFLNATNGQMPMSFVQALLAMGYHPIPLSGDPGEKVVDIGIQRTLAELRSRPGDVLLASHDGDFLPQVEDLLDGERRVGLIAFREFVNLQFAELADRGLEVVDLEDDIHAFTVPLPRVRIIPLASFDPARYL